MIIVVCSRPKLDLRIEQSGGNSDGKLHYAQLLILKQRGHHEYPRRSYTPLCVHIRRGEKPRSPAAMPSLAELAFIPRKYQRCHTPTPTGYQTYNFLF